MKKFSSQAKVLWLIIISAILRMILGASIGLGVDESYVAAVSRHLSLSYFDHPPLHFWLIWATEQLTQSNYALVLRLPFILLFAGTTWLMYCLCAKLFDEGAGFYTALILNISAVFSLSTGSWLLPDGPLMFLMLAAALVLAHIFFGSGEKAPWYWWGLAGILIGLGMLAKYHAFFLLLGSFLFMLTSRGQRQQLFSMGPYLMLLLAGLVFLPVVVWNQEHHWISFVFQGSRGAMHGFYPAKMLGNIAGQAAWILPWIWLPLVCVLARHSILGLKAALGNEEQQEYWLLCCLSLGPIVFFTAAVLFGGQGLFHWQAPGYLLALPLLGKLIAEKFKEDSKMAVWWLRISGALFLAIIMVLGSHTATGWMRQAVPAWFAKGDPTDEAINWSELTDYLEKEGLSASVSFIAAPHWIDAGKIDYSLGGKLPVVCFSSEPHHFAFMHSEEEFYGKDALVIGRKSVAEDAADRYAPYFSNIEKVGSVVITRSGQPEFEVLIFYAKNLRKEFPLPYTL